VLVGPEASAKDINELYLKAWRNGVKALYYQHSINAAQELSRKKICVSCEA
jgi:ribonucleoside-diphosphate reductase alpha chain